MLATSNIHDAKPMMTSLRVTSIHQSNGSNNADLAGA